MRAAPGALGFDPPAVAGSPSLAVATMSGATKTRFPRPIVVRINAASVLARGLPYESPVHPKDPRYGDPQPLLPRLQTDGSGAEFTAGRKHRWPCPDQAEPPEQQGDERESRGEERVQVQDVVRLRAQHFPKVEPGLRRPQVSNACAAHLLPTSSKDAWVRRIRTEIAVAGQDPQTEVVAKGGRHVLEASNRPAGSEPWKVEVGEGQDRQAWPVMSGSPARSFLSHDPRLRRPR